MDGFKFFVMDSCPPDTIYVMNPKDAARTLEVPLDELLPNLGKRQPVVCQDEEKARRILEAQDAAQRIGALSLTDSPKEESDGE